MRYSKFFARFIVLFAFVHALAPSLASIADAWVEQGASRVAQVGEQGSSNYLAAHSDDCALCSAVAAVTGTGEPREAQVALWRAGLVPSASREVRWFNVARPSASQRAPPAVS